MVYKMITVNEEKWKRYKIAIMKKGLTIRQDLENHVNEVLGESQ